MIRVYIPDMDRTELNAIMLISIRRSLLENRLEEAKARFRENTTYYYNGGMFKVSPVMSLTWTPPKGTPFLLIDAVGLPVEISDPEKFYETCQQKYTSALNRFHLDVIAARQEYPQDLFEECAE